MTTIDRIRAEIERRLKYTHDWLRGDEKRHPKQTSVSKNYYKMKGDERTLDALLSFLDTLEEPEQPTRGYDEAYLNEKIAKASKSWKGVDVDKFMDEIRGREQPVTDCNDLEEAADNHIRKVADAAGHPGWDWTTQDIADAFKAGAEWQKAKMMKEAVEGYVNYYEDSGGILMTEAQMGCPYHNGDKVKIIIVKEDK